MLQLYASMLQLCIYLHRLQWLTLNFSAQGQALEIHHYEVQIDIFHSILPK